MTENWIDISKWNKPPEKFFAELLKDRGERAPINIIDLRIFDIDSVKLYCLCKAKVSSIPNGFYTYLIHDKPMGSLFWWDFILESEIGTIHLSRKQSHVEAMINISIDHFDIKEFLIYNFKKYSKEINIIKDKLETHTLFVNHYDSYKKCVEYLWKEIKDIEISHINIKEEIEKNRQGLPDLMETYMENNLKFHTLGKSLILNAAFKIESYLNLLIRITAKPELKEYPDVMKKNLKSNFLDKLKNLKFYTVLLSENVDMDNKAIKDAIKVMTYRNKYVHFDLSSELNKIGVVHFDDDFPVFPSYADSPIVENIKRSFQIPSFEIVKFSHNASNQFVSYIDKLIMDNKWSNGVRMIMSQNPIGFNEQKKVYSAIFSNVLFEGHLGSEILTTENN
jgi:hypothetical protein